MLNFPGGVKRSTRFNSTFQHVDIWFWLSCIQNKNWAKDFWWDLWRGERLIHAAGPSPRPLLSSCHLSADIVTYQQTEVLTQLQLRQICVLCALLVDIKLTANKDVCWCGCARPKIVRQSEIMFSVLIWATSVTLFLDWANKIRSLLLIDGLQRVSQFLNYIIVNQQKGFMNKSTIVHYCTLELVF